MFIVGITGGIGSGKTTISELFNKHFSVPIYNTDQRAKWLINHSNELKISIIELLGKNAFQNGIYNTAYVSQKVFSDPSLLKKLNEIVHPKVAEDFQQWKNLQTSAYVIKESAILIESGAYKTCDCIISVKAPLPLRIERLKLRDKTNQKNIEKKIKSQLTDCEREKFSSFVINNEKLSDILGEIQNIHYEILKMMK